MKPQIDTAQSLVPRPHHRPTIRGGRRRPREVARRQLRHRLMLERVGRIEAVLKRGDEEDAKVESDGSHVIIVQEGVRTLSNGPEHPNPADSSRQLSTS